MRPISTKFFTYLFCCFSSCCKAVKRQKWTPVGVLFLALFFLQGIDAQAQINHAEVVPRATDAAIDLDILPSGDTVKHQIFTNTAPGAAQGKLLVFLADFGKIPGDFYKRFCEIGAYEGYHTIGLVYKNFTPISGSCANTTAVSYTHLRAHETR